MSSRQQVIEAAEKYLFHGLVEHDGSKVPLAPGATRIEQGRNTGDGGDAIREALSWKVMDVIESVANVRWIAEGEQAVAFYDLHVTGSEKPVLIAERFRVVDGLIEEIEAVFVAPAPPG